MTASAVTHGRRRVAILGIDNVSRKNWRQLDGLNRRGFSYDVFTNDTIGDSARHTPPGNSLTVMSPRLDQRLRQLARYLSRHHRELNHAEVYPGGRFAGLYVALARRHGIPTMIVERGDLLYRRRYGRVTALSMHAAYRFADVVWYREFYQAGQRALEDELRSLGARRLFFLPNAIEQPRGDGATERTFGDDAVDFVWVNSLKAERRVRWLVDALATEELAGATCAIMGFLDEHRAGREIVENQAYVRERAGRNVTYDGFGDPTSLFRRGRFFVLPSDMVFCNNALLEAMSCGVIPLVSDVEGARLIVDDGVDGIVFAHSPDGLRDAMHRALRLAPAARAAMSRAAVEKVRTRFGLEQWCDRLAAEYALLGGATTEAGEAAGRGRAAARSRTPATARGR